MATDLQLRYSRSYPAGVKRAYDVVLSAALPEIFDRRYLLIPPIREVRGQDGAWDTVGRTRTIVLADGGTMQERLGEQVRGDHFSYRLDHITGMLAPLVASVDGRWHVAPAGTGVLITWTWQVRLRGRQGALAAPFFARLWRGYARQGFERLEDLLVAGPDPVPGTPAP